MNLANLTGTNRAFIEETVPHIASLMKESVQEVLDDSDGARSGNHDPEFPNVATAEARRPVVIDFSIRASPRSVSARA